MANALTISIPEDLMSEVAHTGQEMYGESVGEYIVRNLHRAINDDAILAQMGAEYEAAAQAGEIGPDLTSLEMTAPALSDHDRLAILWDALSPVAGSGYRYCYLDALKDRVDGLERKVRNLRTQAASFEPERVSRS